MGLRHERKPRVVDVLIGATCDRCGKDWGVAEHGNLDGGVKVTVHGWYGGTIDPGITPSPSLFLCDECATEFLATWFPREL